MNASTSYDTMPYPTGAYAQTHPDRLATIATLLGMTPAPPERCRVLELGCGDGGNLLPMAFVLPESRFLGVDLSSTAIASGRNLIAKAGLTNVALEAQNLLSFEPEPGAFDYVIAHGIYAWVPPPVQDRLLALCRRALAPQGVAIVSYNAYPGSRIREMLRGMMQYHIRNIPEPPRQLEQAKELLKFLSRAWPEPVDLRYWIGKQGESTLNRERDNLFHDELEADYRPVYFHEFMTHAGRHGLQYLGESDFYEMNEELCPPASLEVLRGFGPDRVLEKEQYMDFVKCRAFRQTLLCRADLPLRRRISGAALDRCYVETRVQNSTVDGSEFKSARGATMTTRDPFTRKMMEMLDSSIPRPLSFQELLAEGISEADLRLLLLGLYGTSMIHLRLWKPPCAAVVSDRPAASRFARAQLALGRTVVTNTKHSDLNLVDDDIRGLIRHLDGTRDRAALVRDLTAAGLKVTPNGLEATLKQLARLAVLTS